MPNKKLPKELHAGQRAERFLILDAETRSAIDVEARTVTVAFASETPVERYWGNEILDMNSSSIRLSRLKRGGALLMDHNITDQIGVVDSVQIGADKVARAVVRFGKSARASEIFQDVVDGIRSNISTSYQIFGADLESKNGGVETYRINDWEPYEISLVSVPADTSVGVGRALPNTQEDPPVTEPTVTSAAPAIVPDPAIAQRAGAEGERKRVSEILGITDAYKRYNLGDIAAASIRSGESVDEFRSKAMTHMASAPKPTAELGLTDKEVKRYSFMRALNALANPSDHKLREEAAFEFECSAACESKFCQRSMNGLRVPYDVLNRAQRDLTAGGATTGAPTIATELLGEDFITLLRNRMVINKLGARTLTGLVGNIAIPRLTGAATSYWVAENTAPTESDQATDQVTLSPKTVAAWTDISRRLLLQSSIDVESLVQTDLATVLALAIQSAAINGSGANTPTGILGTTGIGNVAGGTNGANPTFANLVALETAISSANADVGTLAYLTNAKVRGYLKTAPKIGTTFPAFIWGDGDTPINGYQVAVTNAVPSNLTKGTASGTASAVIFGNFSDLLIGMWGGLDLMVDPYSKSTTGAVRVVAMQDCDVAVRHPESFAAMKDALTV